MSIIDSTAFVDHSVDHTLPVIPSRVTVSVSGRPSRIDAAAPGWLRSRSPANASRADVWGRRLASSM